MTFLNEPLPFCSAFPETGGICISPKPSDPDAEIIPGMAMRPFFGIKPVLMDTEVRDSSVNREWWWWWLQPTHRKGWIRIINRRPQRRCDRAQGCCVRANLHIENLPCYFVADCADSWSSHRMGWGVVVCRYNIALSPQGNVQSSSDTSGALCIAQPWPGMARTIHNNHQRFIETYCQPHPGMKCSIYDDWMG